MVHHQFIITGTRRIYKQATAHVFSRKKQQHIGWYTRWVDRVFKSHVNMKRKMKQRQASVQGPGQGMWGNGQWTAGRQRRHDTSVAAYEARFGRREQGVRTSGQHMT